MNASDAQQALAEEVGAKMAQLAASLVHTGAEPGTEGYAQNCGEAAISALLLGFGELLGARMSPHIWRGFGISLGCFVAQVPPEARGEPIACLQQGINEGFEGFLGDNETMRGLQ